MAETALLLAFCLFFTCHTTARAGFGNIEITGRIPTKGLIDRIASAPDTDIAYGIGIISRTLSIIDRNTHKVQGEVSFQTWPAGLAVDPASNNAFVLCQGTSWPVASNGSLTVVSPQGQIVASRPLPRTSRDIAINPENRTAVVTVRMIGSSWSFPSTLWQQSGKLRCPTSRNPSVSTRIREGLSSPHDSTSGSFARNAPRCRSQFRHPPLQSPFYQWHQGIAVDTELDIAAALGVVVNFSV